MKAVTISSIIFVVATIVGVTLDVFHHGWSIMHPFVITLMCMLVVQARMINLWRGEAHMLYEIIDNARRDAERRNG